MDQSDADLLSLLAADLDRDFRQLVLSYQQRLYSFALRLTGSPHDAEDIEQEAFLRAYHALKSYPVLKVRALRLRPWLYAITLNIFRKRKPEHLSISLDTSEDSPMPATSLVQEFSSARVAGEEITVSPGQAVVL